MMQSTSMLLIVLALASAPASAALVPGNNPRTLSFGGLERTYRIHVPPAYDGSVAVPLVLNFHGLGSNGSQQEAISGLDPVSDREGFLLVHPEGVANAWNAGICCGNSTIDDVGFVRAMVAAIQAEANVDARRIYATGLSNGGAMSQRLACDAADLFAASAPLAFPVADNPVGNCQPSRPMPVGMFMGLTDVLVRYEGSNLFPSAVQSFAHWHDVNGCAAGTPDVTVTQGQSRCETHSRCADGAEAMLCSITGISFGGTFFDGHILYANVDDWNLAEVLWGFLSRFTLPEPDGPSALVLHGRGTVQRRGSRPNRAALVWTVAADGAHGDGSWSAGDDAGHVYTGTYTIPRRRGSAVTLTLGETSRSALGTAVSEAIGGGTEVTIDAGASLRGKLNKKGELVRIAGKLALHDTGGGQIGTYAISVAARK